MGANIWFWLIYVLVGVFGILGVGPWGRERLVRGGRLVAGSFVFILVGILGLSVYGSPVR